MIDTQWVLHKDESDPGSSIKENLIREEIHVHREKSLLYCVTHSRGRKKHGLLEPQGNNQNEFSKPSTILLFVGTLPKYVSSPCWQLASLPPIASSKHLRKKMTPCLNLSRASSPPAEGTKSLTPLSSCVYSQRRLLISYGLRILLNSLSTRYQSI